MTIHTVFSVDDEAFLMRENKVVCAIVKMIHVSVELEILNPKATINYTMAVPRVGTIVVPESEAFCTKENLLASL